MPKTSLRYETEFRAPFTEICYQLALLGATVQEIAKALGIADSTLEAWQLKHPELREAISKGRDIADGKVARSLYHRARGYRHKDTDIRVIDGQIVKTEIEKQYPPDTVACIFWLKNRQPKHWRDKIETGTTDKEGNDVPALPVGELARRIAFLLASAESEMNKGVMQ